MENQTKINTGIVTLLLILAGFVSVGTQEDTHYCMDREIKAHCYNFTKYYGLENGKCINPFDGNKLCKSGWEEIPFIISEVPDYSESKGDWTCLSSLDKCYPKEVD